MVRPSKTKSSVENSGSLLALDLKKNAISFTKGKSNLNDGSYDNKEIVHGPDYSFPLFKGVG